MTLRDFITILKLPFRKDRELYRSFYRILGFYPIDIRPYQQALMHKSVSQRGSRGQRVNNERLEFLGDAILDAVVGDIVYRRFPNKPEGFMTNTRSKIVQRESLNKLAVEVGLNRLIKSNGHAQSAHNSYMCGNAFEALVGAVYLDRGYDFCMQFMEKRILKRLVNIDKVAYKEVNFKSKLLEWSQKNRINLNFDLVEEGKEEGSTPTFITRVVIEGIECGTGKGYSKKESQQNAAKEALTQLRKQKELERSVFDAKGKRTAMEEEPTAMLPNIPTEEEEKVEQSPKPRRNPRRKSTPKKEGAEPTEDKTTQESVDIDFSDVKMRTKTRDEIIAEAEAQAFGDDTNA